LKSIAADEDELLDCDDVDEFTEDEAHIRDVTYKVK
jgi:hypothetical protein